jgi:hypothetical protein
VLLLRSLLLSPPHLLLTALLLLVRLLQLLRQQRHRLQGLLQSAWPLHQLTALWVLLLLLLLDCR